MLDILVVGSCHMVTISVYTTINPLEEFMLYYALNMFLRASVKSV